MKRIIDTENINIIGPKIKEARVEAGMSQKELSEKLELMAVYTCRGSISRIENGKRAITDIEIDAISKILNVSLDFLLLQYLFHKIPHLLSRAFLHLAGGVRVSAQGEARVIVAQHIRHCFYVHAVLQSNGRERVTKIVETNVR